MKSYTCLLCGKTKEEQLNPIGHRFGNWSLLQEATVFNAEKQERQCSVCGKKEQKTVGTVLSPIIKLNASSITLQVRQSTNKLKVIKMQKGDSVTSWKSGNNKIIKVSKSGKITAQAKTGKTTITVNLKSGISKKITVKVQKAAVKTKKITGLSKNLSLKKGKTFQLRTTLEPFTSKQKISYVSSNKKVATVSKNGIVRGKKKGIAKITVKSGTKKYIVVVKVGS